MEMAELRRDAGRGAVLLHQQMERGAANWPPLLGQEDRPGEAAAHFQPGAERPSFLAHQVVLTRRNCGLTHSHLLDPPPARSMLLCFYLLEEYIRLRMGLARNGVKGIDR